MAWKQGHPQMQLLPFQEVVMRFRARFGLELPTKSEFAFPWILVENKTAWLWERKVKPILAIHKCALDPFSRPSFPLQSPPLFGNLTLLLNVQYMRRKEVTM